MKDGVESLGRIRLQGVALLGVAFVAGILGGVAVERVRTARPWRDAALDTRPRLGPQGLPPVYERLDLSDAQRRQVTSILERGRPTADSIMRETFPRLRAITDSIRSEIRAVLTPEQQARLDREMERLGPRGAFGPGGPRGFGPAAPGSPFDSGARGGPRRGGPRPPPR